ncbi:MAG: ROK family protein, partial [Actinomycetes bacterium]
MARRPGATQDEMRRHNVSMLLRLVHVHGAVSRAELTSLMGLSRSTIKALVAELAEAGLVVEEIPATGLGAGRPSYVVMPRGDTAYVLGANVGVDSVAVAAVGLGGGVLARREYRIKGLGAKPDVVAGRLASELHRLQTQVPRGAWLVGVGVGVPGIVRRSDGHVEFAPNLTWRDVPFGGLLERRLGLDVPLRVANDGDVGAMAEHVRGAGRGVHTMLYIAGEVGIGGGLVVDGRMLHGAGGYAGEIGHMMVNPTGRGCRCGSVGCLETEIGEEALLRAAGKEPSEGRRGHQRVLAQALA